MAKEAEIVSYLMYYPNADQVSFCLLFNMELTWVNERLGRYKAVAMARNDADGTWRVKVFAYNDYPVVYAVPTRQEAEDCFGIVVNMIVYERTSVFKCDYTVCQNGWNI